MLKFGTYHLNPSAIVYVRIVEVNGGWRVRVKTTAARTPYVESQLHSCRKDAEDAVENISFQLARLQRQEKKRGKKSASKKPLRKEIRGQRSPSPVRRRSRSRTPMMSYGEVTGNRGEFKEENSESESV